MDLLICQFVQTFKHRKKTLSAQLTNIQLNIHTLRFYRNGNSVPTRSTVAYMVCLNLKA